MQRFIFAIPFTSIIEQTSEVFRGVFDDLGQDTVLEHHSNLDPERESFESRLAKENWDAPIVVTTNVQFFESLFAASTSKCRKLHRIARSVVILDEAQTLPVELLKPCLAVLRELAADYHTSIVLCTATQPAIARRDEFPIGLENVREIVSDPQRLYERMRRVQVHKLGRISDEALTHRLAGHDQFLCIVNSRPHAARLFLMLREQFGEEQPDGLFHLSTLMCGQHRCEVIAAIRARLRVGLSCRVISTQLIEAGVDVDFPVVYRSLAGIDSIAQAAGRCNREGRIEGGGTTYVFTPTDVKLRGYLALTAASAAELMPDFDDLLSLDAVQHYFELHYWKQKDRWDEKGILDQFLLDRGKLMFQFRTAASLFRMIEDNSRPIIVPWSQRGEELVAELSGKHPPDWRIQRRLQRFFVPVYEHIYNEMLDRDVTIYHDSYPVLINRNCYDANLGLRIERGGIQEPETLIG